jgi:TonB-dependent starch-binding outer membrane protein SusC
MKKLRKGYLFKKKGGNLNLKKMKLTLLFSFLVFSAAWAESYSQTTKLSLDLKNASVKKFIKEVEDQTDFFFLYQDEVIYKGQKITIQVKDQSLEKVLQLFEEQASVVAEITDNQIVLKNKIIKHKKAVQQPNRQINGFVSDQDGQPLPGVTIVVKGTTTIGTVTNADGEFSLTIPDDAETLQFSFVGMKTQEISVVDKTTFTVIMEVDAIGLEEIVAIGYGTARKKDLTGAVVNVDAEDLMKYKPESVSDLLRSAVPGLKVGYSTNARATPEFFIRGDNTIKADDATERSANAPLIVVDGIIFNGSLSELNVNDIKSVDVLKDASAASIYGSRASNGVVVFTTKSGEVGKPKIRVNAKYGIVTSSKRLTSYDGEKVLIWLEEMNESINNLLQDEWSRFEPYERVPNQYKNDWLQENGIPGETDMNTITNIWLDNFGFESNEKENYFAGRTYDWQDFLFQTGHRQDYNVSVSGRNERISYYWSVGMRDNESV